MPHRIARIVSGGQTGADRAALDAAIELGVSYGGWCPQGGWAEDLEAPPGLLERYPLLREAGSPDPRLRTRLNVRDSDATLIVRTTTAPSAGSDLTARHAARLGRPCLMTSDRAEVRRWLASLPDAMTLNVAGPRESEEPGIYAATRALLLGVLDEGGSRSG